MKHIKTFAIALFFTAAVLASTAFINAKLLKSVNATDKGFAVVELFTSEGCSSCPPADQLVAKIEKEDADKSVYILAYHVDYWNNKAWKDGFSSADYSKRQRDYAPYLHIQSVYTPQIVVDGKTEFVGSEESTLRNAIRGSLAKAPSASLSLDVAGTSPNHATINYATQDAGSNTVLLLAVVEKNAHTKVGGGENNGRMLSHVQIVRELQKVNLKGKGGEVKISLPQGFDTSGWEIIGILQNTSTGEVTAAARAAVS